MSNYQIHIEQTKYETFFHFLEVSFLIIHFSPFTAWGLGKVIKVPEVAGKVKNKNHYRHIIGLTYMHVLTLDKKQIKPFAQP